MHILRADTQTKVLIGPAISVADGYTPVITLTLGAADEAGVMKHDAAAVTDISGNTFDPIGSMDGYYNLTLTAGQLDTEGRLTIGISDDSLVLPIRQPYMVVNANVYDSLFAAATTDYLQVDVIEIGASASSASNLMESTQAIIPGTCSGTPTTQSCNSDLIGFADNELIGRAILFQSGVANGQGSDITDYAQSGGIITYTAIPTPPNSGDTFVIV